jgi:uncharacterized protein YbjT (DUF2867 family)
MQRVAVVGGGTGLLGQAVVHALHQQQEDHFDITVISRSQPQAPLLPRVNYCTIDTYTDEEDGPLVHALRGHDVLISMLGGPIAPTGNFPPPCFHTSDSHLVFPPHNLRKPLG